MIEIDGVHLGLIPITTTQKEELKRLAIDVMKRKDMDNLVDYDLEKAERIILFGYAPYSKSFHYHELLPRPIRSLIEALDEDDIKDYVQRERWGERRMVWVVEMRYKKLKEIVEKKRKRRKKR